MGMTKKMREERRLQAETRNAEFAKLTPEQKLAKLDAGGFAAKKQRAKIQASLTK